MLKKTIRMQLYGCRLIVAAPHKIENMLHNDSIMMGCVSIGRQRAGGCSSHPPPNTFRKKRLVRIDPHMENMIHKKT